MSGIIIIFLKIPHNRDREESVIMDSSLALRFEAMLRGEEKRAYEMLGVHKEDASCIFRVFAPNAEETFVVGDFNGWQNTHPMKKIHFDGLWELSVDEKTLCNGDLYKFKFIKNGEEIYKSDPYCFMMDAPPECASVYAPLRDYKWHDKGWMEQRMESADCDVYAQPMNIYELHAASWKKHEDGSLLNYKELAHELAPYLKQMGYTHVELMPVTEHPFIGSWGYQVGSYFAPTRRFGSPEDLMSFVDIMHSAGLSVIFDWVPAHFPKDRFGLLNFDGGKVYEYEDSARAEIRSWGTVRFDTGKGAVRSFLISNALYWIEKYHVDGLRVDAVSSMIYLDCEASGNSGVPDVSEKNLCFEAIEFLKQLNKSVKDEHPDVIMIAEESGIFEGVTSPEGLGFDFKWNMGWMNDTLRYATSDFHDRKNVHDRLTFPLVYAYNEKYILPISHDEVVYGKKSFLDKMPGDYWRKFAGARAFEALKMTVPGKKLTFMGCEIGQFREWRCEESVEWFLLDYESHARHQLYCADLNHFYLAHGELWQLDGDRDGFLWLEADDSERSIISYVRRDRAGRELVIAINMTPETYPDGFLPVPREGVYEEIFNSDSKKYGGSGVTNEGAELISRPNPDICRGKPSEMICPYAVRMRIPPLAVTVLRRIKDK